MARPRNRTRDKRTEVLGSPTAPARRDHEHYVHGATGAQRPKGSDKYLLDGQAHRFDGKCHPDCENLR